MSLLSSNNLQNVADYDSNFFSFAYQYLKEELEKSFSEVLKDTKKSKAVEMRKRDPPMNTELLQFRFIRRDNDSISEAI